MKGRSGTQTRPEAADSGNSPRYIWVVRYVEFPPHPRLRPYVRTCWTLAGSGADMPPQPVLPDGCTELIVHRARPFRRHHANDVALSAPLVIERQSTRLFVG